MPDLIDPRWFDGLSIYQDVILNGQVVRQGVRDCDQRWRLIEPHLPRSGAFLDVGSNFGWFGLKICETHPQSVVASVEADPRSALIQRKVLETHEHRRIALLTARANCRLLARFAAAGQNFEAALCLSILHWLPDHRRFLQGLGRIARRIVIEYPHADEQDAGSARIRGEIGDFGEYLRAVFPGHRLREIGQSASHLNGACQRPIWLVESRELKAVHSDGLIVSPLIENGLVWPNRSWWLDELRRSNRCETTQDFPRELELTATGLSASGTVDPSISRRLKRLPEVGVGRTVSTWRARIRHGVGRLARRFVHVGQVMPIDPRNPCR